MFMSEAVNGVKGFVTIFGKPLHLLVCILGTILVGSIMWVFSHPIFDEMVWNYCVIAGLLFLLVPIILFVSLKAGKKEEEAFDRQQRVLAENEKEIHRFREQEASIAEAVKMIREWKELPPPDNKKGFYPYGNGVKLEYKVTSSGKKSAILHVEGRPTEKFRLI
jgi:hypothetical protein